MRAAVLTEPGRPLEILEVDPLAVGLGQVRVELGASGVCHSDLSVQQGSMPAHLPCIQGHEAAGTVVEVGPSVDRVQVGDRVVGAFIPACGNCWYCVRDLSHHCEQLAVNRLHHGATLVGQPVFSQIGIGCFAQSMVVDQSSVVPVRTDLAFAELALFGCGLTTGVGAVLRTAQVRPGASVVVLGCGGVGLAAVQGARIAAADRIIAVDPVASKRQAALDQGATEAIDPTAVDVAASISETTDGRGVDHVFEVTGIEGQVQLAIALLRKGGSAVLIGLPRAGTTTDIPWFQMVGTGKQVLGSVFGSARVRRDIPMLVGLAERGILDLDGMVSRRIALSQVNEAFEAMATGEVVRSVIVDFER